MRHAPRVESAAMCGRGGTGRRSGLKIRRPHGYVGSSPTARTIPLPPGCFPVSRVDHLTFRTSSGSPALAGDIPIDRARLSLSAPLPVAPGAARTRLQGRRGTTGGRPGFSLRGEDSPRQERARQHNVQLPTHKTIHIDHTFHVLRERLRLPIDIWRTGMHRLTCGASRMARRGAFPSGADAGDQSPCGGPTISARRPARWTPTGPCNLIHTLLLTMYVYNPYTWKAPCPGGGALTWPR